MVSHNEVFSFRVSMAGAPGDFAEAPLRYAALDASGGRRPIRLVALLPGSTSDVLQCNLIPCDLEDDLDYEALSYSWGSAVDKKPIICDDARLDVTTNLEAALRHLRHGKDPRVFWIDHICINQSDLDEREQQVSIMRDIYSKASGVVVWLGEPAENDKLAFSVCERLVSSIGTRMKPTGREMVATPSVLPKRTSTTPDAPRVQDVAHLLALTRRPWFKRVWVIQETAVAARIVVAFGSEQIELDKLYIGLAISGTTTLHGLQRMARSIQTLLFQYELRENGGPNSSLRDLAKLLLYTRRFEATDPRDKVYALYGLTSASFDALDVRADYHMKVADLYTKVTYALLKQGQTLDLLEVPRGVSNFRQTLPSWVPDWSDSSTFEVPFVESAFDDYLGNLSTRISRLLQALKTTDALRVPMEHEDPTFGQRLASSLSEEDRLNLGNIHVHRTYHMGYSTEQIMRIFKGGEDEGVAESSGRTPRFAAAKHTETSSLKLGEDMSLSLTGHAVDKIIELGGVHLPLDAQRDKSQEPFDNDKQPRAARLLALTQRVLSKSRQSIDLQLKWDDMALIEEPYPTGETQLRAYWQTLCGGHLTADIEKTEVDFLNHQKVLRNARAVDRVNLSKLNLAKLQPSMIPGYERGPARKGPRQPSDFVGWKAMQRRLARTDRGYLGLVPSDTKAGDVIVLLHGGRLPFVLRPHDGHWEMIGPSYVHGIMHGEAFYENIRGEFRIM